jgi:hypothetical protein
MDDLGVAGPKTQDGDFVTLVLCMDDLGVVPKTAVSSRSGRALHRTISGVVPKTAADAVQLYDAW